MNWYAGLPEIPIELFIEALGTTEDRQAVITFYHPGAGWRGHGVWQVSRDGVRTPFCQIWSKDNCGCLGGVLDQWPAMHERWQQALVLASGDAQFIGD